MNPEDFTPYDNELSIDYQPEGAPLNRLQAFVLRHETVIMRALHAFAQCPPYMLPPPAPKTIARPQVYQPLDEAEAGVFAATLVSDRAIARACRKEIGC
ncbi:MAG: hypothetical protein JWN38_837 [Candidatus Saccharibacteria bacterium]|nr:hypothetical protein [Candidatus Saccharibacteria bacterium]